MVRQLGFEEFKTIYKERLRADFPREERRPLAAIKGLYRQGCYTCLLLEEEGRALAYATFIHSPSIANVFLDYFAVEEGRRGSGVGSRFLAMLRAQWPGKRGIILECEDPETAKDDPAEQATRLRRIDFYRRGGAQTTPLLWHAFGVDYCILWLPILEPSGLSAGPAPEQGDVAHDLQALYALALPPAIQKHFTRLRAAEGTPHKREEQ